MTPTDRQPESSGDLGHPQNIPRAIQAALEPDESIEAVFGMDSGLDIYTTDRRFFGKKQDHLAAVRYTEVTEAVRRTACWKTWHGVTRILVGAGFLAAGMVSGFADATAAVTSLVLFVTGAGLVLLGILRRDDWVELKLQRSEPQPSFWYLVMFLPFWLMLKSSKRYRVPGKRAQVDAFHRYLTTRCALPTRAKQPERFCHIRSD